MRVFMSVGFAWISETRQAHMPPCPRLYRRSPLHNRRTETDMSEPDDQFERLCSWVHHLHSPVANMGLYGEVYEDSRTSRTVWTDFDVDATSDLAINQAFEVCVRDSRYYGWAEELWALEIHWASLRHWRLAYPAGIPDPGSAAHSAVMRYFQTRHVHHPYELCSCKGKRVPRVYGCFCNDKAYNMR